MRKQSLIKGSIILGMAGIIAKFLGIFFRWPLIMLIGDEGVGYYQMSYPLYMFFIALSAGVPVAISKMVSENNALGNKEDTFQIIREAFLLMVILGTGTSLFLFFGARPLISLLKWDSKAYFSLIGISFAPIIMTFTTIYRGFFQGLQNMTPSAISQILEQIARVIVGVGLAIILLPRGIEYSAGGAAFGATAGALLGGSYLYFKYRKVKKEFGIKRVPFNPEVLNRLLKISIPISLGATVGSVMGLIDSVLVPRKLLEAGLDTKTATILYAQLTGKAAVLTNIPLTLSMALCASIVPIIAENYILSNKEEVISKVNTSLKLSFTIALPSLAGLYFLALPIMQIIFPGRYDGYEILKYLSISIPFIVLAQTTTAILQSTGRYIIPVINLLIGCGIKIFLTSTLVSINELNVYGAVIASISAYLVSSILNLICLKMHLKLKIKFYEILIKPAYATIVMIIGVMGSYVALTYKINSPSLACLISIFLGIIIYIVLIVILGVFKYDTIRSRLRR
ncbi:polysaccharide biosynthesis protein [Clostridium sp. YIM B02551]|uniref:putative polysaccharide biosynthesis protein n=1 Tax=Clostridium sp. YIM B02551 TaxID=2910679 RepID=UPI001EEA0D81|nr:polysaccharide biosynthesis protein [Clostridium sp. YIM B02551]